MPARSRSAAPEQRIASPGARRGDSRRSRPAGQAPHLALRFDEKIKSNGIPASSAPERSTPEPSAQPHPARAGATGRTNPERHASHAFGPGRVAAGNPHARLLRLSRTGPALPQHCNPKQQRRRQQPAGGQQQRHRRRRNQPHPRPVTGRKRCSCTQAHPGHNCPHKKPHERRSTNRGRCCNGTPIVQRRAPASERAGRLSQ